MAPTVRLMRYLRHAPLTFWVATVLLFTAVGFLAMNSGDAKISVNTTSPQSISTGRAQAFALMQRISGAYPALTADSFTTWATGTAEMARNGLAEVKAANGPTDRLTLGWQSVVSAAEALVGTDPGDTPQIIERVAQLNTAAQTIVELTSLNPISAQRAVTTNGTGVPTLSTGGTQ